MARFQIKTPEAFWTGNVAGVAFARGEAVITSDTDEGMRALYYFKSAGYGIAPLDEVTADEVLARHNEDPAAEHARLTAANEGLRNRLEIDKLRDENRALEAKVFKADTADPTEVQAAQQGEGSTQPPLQAPPAESAPVADWRKWAVDSGRATAEEAKALDKPQIIAQHGAAYDAERAERLRLEAERSAAA